MNKSALILALAALTAGPALAADPAKIDWSKIPAVNVPVFYPGQSSYEWLRSDAHKGAVIEVKRGDACASCHDEPDGEKDRWAKLAAGGPLERNGRWSRWRLGRTGNRRIQDTCRRRDELLGISRFLRALYQEGGTDQAFPCGEEEERGGVYLHVLAGEAGHVEVSPDYKEEGRREIKVGPSKGYRIAHEFVDLLEARSRVDPDKVDLSRVDYETNVLVIGGGGAATVAAIIAEENGARVLMATKLRHGDSNTMMAEGGIQAATKREKDSPYYHYLGVLGGGHFQQYIT